MKPKSESKAPAGTVEIKPDVSPAKKSTRGPLPHRVTYSSIPDPKTLVKTMSDGSFAVETFDDGYARETEDSWYFADMEGEEELKGPMKKIWCFRLDEDYESFRGVTEDTLIRFINNNETETVQEKRYFEKYLFHAVESGFIRALNEIIRRNFIDFVAQIAGDSDCKDTEEKELRDLYGRAVVCAALRNQVECMQILIANSAHLEVLCHVYNKFNTKNALKGVTILT